MPDTRPNIIVITTDQQRTDSLSAYGSAFTSTPHIDRLAREGVQCERAYCTNPVCTPSRVSLFTGQTVGRHGAWNVGMSAHANTRTIAHDLADAGYATCNIGKLHFQAFGGAPEASRESGRRSATEAAQFTGPYYGFQQVEMSIGHGHGAWRNGHYGAYLLEHFDSDELKRMHEGRCAGEGHPGAGFDIDLPQRFHHTAWVGDRTTAFIEAHVADDRPFMLGVGFPDPHHPHAVPSDVTDRVSPDDVPLPDYDEGELDDKPPHFREAHFGTLEQSSMRGEHWIAGQGPGADYSKVAATDARLGRAYYHTMVRMIDTQIGRIMSTLEAHGIADNTLVVFTSDHGELLGDHGFWMKGPFHYEQLVRVPLIIRWPGGIDSGRRMQGVTSLVDIAPTCLHAAGVEPEAFSHRMDGCNMLPCLRGESDSVRGAAFVEFVDDPNCLRLKTIVTPDRKLTMYHGQPYGELYDLAADPREKRNLWDDRAYASDKADLLRRMLDATERAELPQRATRTTYA